MDHQPYETWLLDDELLTPEQERDLRSHLRACPDCSVLARTNMVLRSASMTTPPEGFVLHFQSRLEGQHAIQRRRTVFGITLLTLAGTGLVVWTLFPYLNYFLVSPTVFVSELVNNLIAISLMMRAVNAIGDILLNVLVSFIPPYVLAGSAVFFVSIAALWVVSLRKFGKSPETA